jgi:hypothetical protein
LEVEDLPREDAAASRQRKAAHQPKLRVQLARLDVSDIYRRRGLWIALTPIIKARSFAQQVALAIALPKKHQFESDDAPLDGVKRNEADCVYLSAYAVEEPRFPRSRVCAPAAAHLRDLREWQDRTRRGAGNHREHCDLDNPRHPTVLFRRPPNT